jgi:hypothetical protein
MAKVTTGTTVLEVDAQELSLIKRGLQSLDTFESLAGSDETRLRQLRADLSGE